MRKAKRNAAKYARNYRKISQRRMTGYDYDDRFDNDCKSSNNDKSSKSDELEQKRLESVLKNAQQIWKPGLTNSDDFSVNEINLKEDVSLPSICGKKRNRANQCGETTEKNESNSPVENENILSILSPELRDQFSDITDVVILPSSNSSGKKTTNVSKRNKGEATLSIQEIKAAKSLYKNTKRKLVQLEMRKKQKELRKKLYGELEKHSILAPVRSRENATDDGYDERECERRSESEDKKLCEQTLSKSAGVSFNTTSNAFLSISIDPNKAQGLLLKSSELGKKLTKRQKLKKLREKEALGLKLTEEEIDELYVRYDAPLIGSSMSVEDEATAKLSFGSLSSSAIEKVKEIHSLTKSSKKREKRANCDVEGDTYVPNVDDSLNETKEDDLVERSLRLSRKKEQVDSSGTKGPLSESHDSINDIEVLSNNTQSCVQMMLASLSNLKTKTDSLNVELSEKKSKKLKEEKEAAMILEKKRNENRKVYIPTEAIKVSTKRRYGDNVGADSSDIAVADSIFTKHINVQKISRPVEIEESRYNLPVSAMEYEIIDAVRSNDCTILCGETGSGKSTQVPQFLYEAGFSISSEENISNQHLLIGITQPRRVAALSTAKRVCYEMGRGDGQTIRHNGSGNLVAYQTRYETAGLGTSTHIKFMTDGILLQEIQSDLLLRKYGAIVIDEAHERNLNTDVLLGLLSMALPLRRKAAEEGSLPPLKLVIMSATMRVSDFMDNPRLFQKETDGIRPSLVKVPGRTHSVSIHHSKITELDDYEKAAFHKTCKIHRKLPPGGILVFLTGKQEIVRMVKRLRQKLEPDVWKSVPSCERDVFKENDVNLFAAGGDTFEGLRDIDDEEIDGDLFQSEDVDNTDYFDDNERNSFVNDATLGGNDDKLPTKIRILPLYSMLSVDEQAKVFAPLPEDTRLIVIATNIAETSITIPGISYVVDSGRQKCRNYHAGTGVASYDVMWISKAAADQRAGRAGRMGPGHCYRLYSSSVYSRHLDDFALPEVLTQPLENVVLAMKAMHIPSVSDFPFPTPPEKSQILAAVNLLANLGCLDISNVEKNGGDGYITDLGAAVAKLPLGVRYGKMLLVAAQAKVLDYAIALVAVLSESNPFINKTGKKVEKDIQENAKLDSMTVDNVDHVHCKPITKWMHDGGDVLAAMKAVGAYSYACRSPGGDTEKVVSRRFCEENGLNLVIMQRIAKMRLHLSKLVSLRFPHAEGIVVTTEQYIASMPPPKKVQECLLRQAITSGLLDNIARRAPLGVLPPEFSGVPTTAYISSNSKLKDPLYIDKNSAVHSKRPEWVCFDSIIRKKKKDGTTAVIMQRVTPIDPEWLSTLCQGSNLISIGCSLATPVPRYEKVLDSIQCAVETKFGHYGWEVPPMYVDMYNLVHNNSQSNHTKQNAAVMKDDSFRWFARYLLEGKILFELSVLLPMLNDEPSIITRRKPLKKVALLVSALSNAGVDSVAALKKHWVEKDNKFLFNVIKLWIKKDCVVDAKRMWIQVVTKNVKSRPAQV